MAPYSFFLKNYKIYLRLLVPNIELDNYTLFYKNNRFSRPRFKCYEIQIYQKSASPYLTKRYCKMLSRKSAIILAKVLEFNIFQDLYFRIGYFQTSVLLIKYNVIPLFSSNIVSLYFSPCGGRKLEGANFKLLKLRGSEIKCEIGRQLKGRNHGLLNIFRTPWAKYKILGLGWQKKGRK